MDHRGRRRRRRAPGSLGSNRTGKSGGESAAICPSRNFTSFTNHLLITREFHSSLQSEIQVLLFLAAKLLGPSL